MRTSDKTCTLSKYVSDFTKNFIVFNILWGKGTKNVVTLHNG